MPRIAVAVIVVLTIGASIGINIARFPVVWEMVNRPTKQQATKDPAATPTTPAAPSTSPSREVVDLSDFTPPSIRRDMTSSDTSRSPRTLETPVPVENTLPDDNLQSSLTDPASNSFHLISKPRAEANWALSDTHNMVPPSNTPVDPIPYPAESRPPAESVPADVFNTSEPVGTEHFPTPNPVSTPITFGSTAAPPIDSVINNPTQDQDDAITNVPVLDAGLPDAGVSDKSMPSDTTTSSTTWPARMAPSLKLGAKPLIAEEGQDVWFESRPMVPVVRPEQKKSASTSLTRPSPIVPLVERFPKIMPIGQSVPKSHSRSPEALIPLYPNTGR